MHGVWVWGGEGATWRYAYAEQSALRVLPDCERIYFWDTSISGKPHRRNTEAR